jgi:hypothetical protein
MRDGLAAFLRDPDPDVVVGALQKIPPTRLPLAE